MSKKDYIQFAELLARNRNRLSEPSNDWLIIMAGMCDIFKKDNANFDSARFKAACYA